MLLNNQQRARIVKLLRRIKLFASKDNLNENKTNEILTEFLKKNEFVKINSIELSHFIVFFLTNKFIRTKEFKEDISKKENKVILFVILEEIFIPSTMELNLNDYFIIHFFDSMSISEKKEVIERINKIFINRLINLMILDPIRKDTFEINSIKIELKVIGSPIKKIDLIDENYAILTTDFKNKEIMIINLLEKEIIGKIGDVKDLSTESQCYGWVDHVNMIFCYKKQRDHSRESKCCLFDKQGNYVKTVYSLDNRIYDVQSFVYCKETFECCLNVITFKTSKILILNETFNFVKLIDHHLLTPQFSLSYASNIKLFDIEYFVFNYNANIALLQEKGRCKDVYVVDKSNYTIVDVINLGKRSVIGLGEESFLSKGNYKYNNRYLIHKIRFPKYNLPECIPACKLNPLKISHLL